LLIDYLARETIDRDVHPVSLKAETLETEILTRLRPAASSP
jgi:hypothetical protein